MQGRANTAESEILLDGLGGVVRICLYMNVPCVPESDHIRFFLYLVEPSDGDLLI